MGDRHDHGCDSCGPRRPDDVARAGLRRALLGKTLTWQGSDAPDVRFRQFLFGEAMVSDITIPPLRLRLRPATGDARCHHLVIHLEGHGVYHCAGREIHQAPGDIVLLDGATDCEVMHTAGARVHRWSLSNAFLAPFLPSDHRGSILHLDGDEAHNAVLARFARDLADEAERMSPAARADLLTHLCGILGTALAVGSRPCASKRPDRRVQLRHRILTLIQLHHRDPDLDVRRIAQELGMSPRWLHAVLGRFEGGFAEIVAARRLEDGFRLLRDRDCDDLSIAEIAFRAGFNDLSTFYRRFKARYGITPRIARRLRAADASAESASAPSDDAARS